ncbi:MAG: hypothetical protein QQN63_00130 [Nitrosopumilus sp.]
MPFFSAIAAAVIPAIIGIGAKTAVKAVFGGGGSEGGGVAATPSSGGVDPRVGVVAGGGTTTGQVAPQAIQAAQTASIDEEENEAVTLAKQWSSRLTIGA